MALSRLPLDGGARRGVRHRRPASPGWSRRRLYGERRCLCARHRLLLHRAPMIHRTREGCETCWARGYAPVRRRSRSSPARSGQGEMCPARRPRGGCSVPSGFVYVKSRTRTAYRAESFYAPCSGLRSHGARFRCAPQYWPHRPRQAGTGYLPRHHQRGGRKVQRRLEPVPGLAILHGSRRSPVTSTCSVDPDVEAVRVGPVASSRRSTWWASCSRPATPST